MPQSYKIFIKDKPLLLLKKDVSFENSYYQIDNLFLTQPDKFLEKDAIWDSADGFFIHSDAVKEDFETLKQHIHIIHAAGGLVWNSEDELLMIYRRGYWDLPKGKIELGESIEDAALREVEEETGVGNLTLKEKKGSTFHIYYQKEWILKETHWFTMHCSAHSALIAQTEEGISEVCWVKKQDIPHKMKASFSSIREIVGNI